MNGKNGIEIANQASFSSFMNKAACSLVLITRCKEELVASFTSPLLPLSLAFLVRAAILREIVLFMVCKFTEIFHLFIAFVTTVSG
jgi:hypothetical protein